MIKRDALRDDLAQRLDVDGYQDYCENGLQVEGTNEIRHIITAVSASQAAIDFAVAQKADALVVHHGLLWGQGVRSITGVLRERLTRLHRANINLFAYHLPLDCDSIMGNNVLIADDLGLSTDMVVSNPWQGIPLLAASASLPRAISFNEYCQLLTPKWGDLKGHSIEVGDRLVKQVAWSTGASYDAIEDAARWGCDVFISGEATERTYHLAHELGVHFIRLGHHATERYGVRALGEYCQAHYGVEQSFFDEPNPF